MSKYFQRMFMLINLSLGYLFYDTYSYCFVNKCCIDHLLCMVDVFRLSGTTDEAIIDDRRQDMNGNRKQVKSRKYQGVFEVKSRVKKI